MRGTKNRGTTRRVRAALSAAVAVCAVTAALPAVASARPTAVAGTSGAGVELISLATDGTQADGDSDGASITADGRRVAFLSLATNLGGSSSSGTHKQVYVRDRRTSQTAPMSSITSAIRPPVISGDGQYAAHWGQLLRDTKVFLSQVGTGRTIGINCSGLSCGQPSLSADGRYIANVATHGRPATRQTVEVADWQANTTELVAEFFHTSPARPSISADGEYVAYQDGAAQDVWLWNRTDGTTSDPIEGPATAATLVQLSQDGRKVVYLAGSDTHVYDVASDTDQLVPDVRGVAIDPTGTYLLYAPSGTSGPSPLTLRDLRTGTDEVVSAQPATAETGSVTAGGRDVVFQSTADDIVPGDTNGRSDAFVRSLY
ncbi:hypothetical protein [Streptomyces sp. NPDC057877]|uniref:hypothetical protein n=1 Tax=Streptomyces sp. NPDC057877 TaxID=3346269 RepID=UPI0036B6641C